MNELFLISFIIFFLYIWFDTDAFVEWCKLLRLKFIKYKEFEETRNKRLTVGAFSYLDFLLLKYNNFFTRLITCPYCFAVWINIFALIACNYPLKWLGINVILSWVGYASLQKFLKKMYE